MREIEDITVGQLKTFNEICIEFINDPDVFLGILRSNHTTKKFRVTDCNDYNKVYTAVSTSCASLINHRTRSIFELDIVCMDLFDYSEKMYISFEHSHMNHIMIMISTRQFSK